MFLVQILHSSMPLHFLYRFDTPYATLSDLADLGLKRGNVSDNQYKPELTAAFEFQ